MYLGDGNCGIHVLGEGFLKKACVCSAKDDSVVGVELYVDDLVVVGTSNGDSDGKFDFDRGFRGGYHGVFVGVLHGDDEVGEFCRCMCSYEGGIEYRSRQG